MKLLKNKQREVITIFGELSTYKIIMFGDMTALTPPIGLFSAMLVTDEWLRSRGFLDED